ncbi:MAG: hypothetical protein LQ351_003399 [Letrouitia transgressa]|nr:MAG: hypothetical protein LQ351_003399 [Letrouitia transgressa]
MSGQAYPFGDVSPPDENGYKAPKTEDAANFGLFKNNCACTPLPSFRTLSHPPKIKLGIPDSNCCQIGGTIRANCRQFQGQSVSDWRNGAVLNTDDKAAIQCQHEQIENLGEGGFYEKQRGIPGQGGSYGNAVGFIRDYLNQGHLEDTWVTYYNLPGV